MWRRYEFWLRQVNSRMRSTADHSEAREVGLLRHGVDLHRGDPSYQRVCADDSLALRRNSTTGRASRGLRRPLGPHPPAHDGRPSKQVDASDEPEHLVGHIRRSLDHRARSEDRNAVRKQESSRSYRSSTMVKALQPNDRESRQVPFGSRRPVPRCEELTSPGNQHGCENGDETEPNGAEENMNKTRETRHISRSKAILILSRQGGSNP